MLRMNFLKTAFVSMLVVCAMGFYSCSSDEGEPEKETGESSIVGKWDVQSNTRAAGDTKYGSFEFTADNKYIITQPAVATNGDKYMLVIFGDYNATGGENNEFTLNLKEFGTIIIAITKNTASITIDGVVYVAVKAPEKEQVDKKLIGTWKVKSKFDDEPDFTDDGTITFTTAGTYLTSYIDDETGKLQTDNGTWSWKSNDVINISYESYWESLAQVDPETGEIIKPSESWVETEFEDWKFTKITDTEFIAEIDDFGDICIMIGTKE